MSRKCSETWSTPEQESLYVWIPVDPTRKNCILCGEVTHCDAGSEIRKAPRG